MTRPALSALPEILDARGVRVELAIGGELAGATPAFTIVVAASWAPSRGQDCAVFELRKLIESAVASSRVGRAKA